MMIPSPFLDLYVAACLGREDALLRPVAPQRRPLWAHWLARLLVRLASELAGAHVRIEYPAASAKRV
jgi:hypothetical protein